MVCMSMTVCVCKMVCVCLCCYSTVSDPLFNPQSNAGRTSESSAPALLLRPAGGALLALLPARPPTFSAPLCAPVGWTADLGQRPLVSGCCPCGLPSAGLLPPLPRRRPRLRLGRHVSPMVESGVGEGMLLLSALLLIPHPCFYTPHQSATSLNLYFYFFKPIPSFASCPSILYPPNHHIAISFTITLNTYTTRNG